MVGLVSALLREVSRPLSGCLAFNLRLRARRPPARAEALLVAEEVQQQLFAERIARTAREQTQLRLQEEHERYRTLSRRLEVILEGIPDGVTVQDRTGAVVFANTAAARASG